MKVIILVFVMTGSFLTSNAELPSYLGKLKQLNDLNDRPYDTPVPEYEQPVPEYDRPEPEYETRLYQYGPIETSKGGYDFPAYAVHRNGQFTSHKPFGRSIQSYGKPEFYNTRDVGLEMPMESNIRSYAVPYGTEMFSYQLPVNTQVVTYEQPIETSNVQAYEVPDENDVVPYKQPYRQSVPAYQVPVTSHVGSYEIPAESSVEDMYRVPMRPKISSYQLPYEVPMRSRVESYQMPMGSNVETYEIPMGTNVETYEIPVSSNGVPFRNVRNPRRNFYKSKTLRSSSYVIPKSIPYTIANHQEFMKPVETKVVTYEEQIPVGYGKPVGYETSQELSYVPVKGAFNKQIDDDMPKRESDESESSPKIEDISPEQSLKEQQSHQQTSKLNGRRTGSSVEQ